MNWKKWLIIFGILIGLIAVFKISVYFHIVSLHQIISWVDLARHHSGYKILFYLIFTFGVMVFPITLFPIIGGVLFDFWIALPLNTLAATLGAVLSFLLTRRLGREKAKNYFGGGLAIVDRLALHNGLKSILIIRLMGVPPFIVANYALGFSAVRIQDFIWGTMLGILPWLSIVTYAAHSLWAAALKGGEQGLRAALLELIVPFSIISGIVILCGLFGYWRKRITSNYSNL